MRHFHPQSLGRAMLRGLAHRLRSDVKENRTRKSRLRVESLEDRTTPTQYLVSNTNDAGGGSLRQAITDANTAPGADEIIFDAGGVFGSAQTISLLSALPQITNAGGALTITGTGAANLNVRRDPGAATNFRIFDSTTTSLTMTGLTISGGNVTGTGGGLQSNASSAVINLTGVTFKSNSATGNGGALYVTTANSNVTLDGTKFTANSSGSNGGAVFMNTGTFLTVKNSAMSGNIASADGGALYFFSGGSLVVDNSTLSGNRAGSASVGGGALYFFGAATAAPPAGYTANTLIVSNSSITNNTSALAGGAFVLPSFTGTLQVINSTLTGNTASTSGGAIAITSGAGSLAVIDSTIVGNTASATAANTGGGGIARTSTTAGTVNIANSIVSNNTNINGPDILSSSVTTTNVNFSAVGSSTGWTASGTSGNNLAPGTNLLLTPLGNFGGSTRTIAPLPGSPVLDAGSDALVPVGFTLDQRGGSFVRNAGTVDIGAVESQAPYIPIAASNATNVTTGGGTSYQFTVTFSDPTGTNNGIDVSTLINNSNAVRVSGPGGFDVPATYVGVDNSTNGTPRTVTYSITPPGGSWDDVDNGTYTVNVVGNQVADIDGAFVVASDIGTFSVQTPFVVTTTADAGAGSLRNAIIQANAAVGPDMILFSPSVFSTPQTISLLSALPQITAVGGGLTLTGPGASLLTVRRDPAAATNFRIFDSTAPTLSMSGMTLTGGNVTGNGGAIDVPSATTGTVVTLDNMVITGNSATSFGGAVFLYSTNYLMVRNSLITGNMAATGGALYFFSGGGLVVSNSVISGNQATGTGVGGGALYFFGTPSAAPPAGFTASTVLISNSTIANNTSATAGGAFVMPSFGGTLLIRGSTFSGNSTTGANGTTGGAITMPGGALTIQNSTFTANTAVTSGGAVAVTGGTGTINIQDSTIAGNTANGTVVGQGGGGIARTSTSAGTFNVVNSVISNNNNASGPDILTALAGSTVNVNFSAVGSTTGFTLSGTSANNIAPGTDLLLGSLGSNGGLTQTMAPLPGSPLINAGDNASVPAILATDQIGGTHDRLNGTVDIGAYEVQPPKVTIDQATGQGDPTNGSPVQYSIVFNVPVTGFTTAGIDLTSSSFGGLIPSLSGSGTTYSLSVSGMNGEGDVIAKVLAGSALDNTQSSNAASTSTDNTIHFDNQGPHVTIEQGAGQIDATNSSPVVFDVVFSEPTFGFDASDVSFTGSTVGGTLVANVIANSSTSYTVQVTGMSGDGLVVASIPASAAADALGNTSFASTSADNSVRYDDIAPTVTIDQGATQTDPINASPVTFDVHFSEKVTGFDGSDIDFTGSTVGGTLVANATDTGNGKDYTVSVTGMTGDGLIVASIPALATLDLAGNSSTASTSTDNSVRYDDIVPTVTIDQDGSQADPINIGPIVFDVHFSEQVTGFTGSSISFAGSTVGGTLVALVTDTGNSQDFTVSVSGMSGDGQLVASIPAAAAHDLAGNANTASTSTDSSVHFDNISPTVTVSQAAGQADPTEVGPIVFDVHFSEPITGFDATDVSFTGSTVGGTLVANVTDLGNGQDFTITVTGMSGDGLVVASIPAGSAIDGVNNPNLASSGGDNSVRFDNVVPTVTINQGATQLDPINTGPVVFDVHFSEQVTGFTGSDISFTGSTVGGTLVANVTDTGNGKDYTVSVTGMTGDGLVVASIPASTAADLAGNSSAASTSSDNSVRFDNVIPTVTIDQGTSQVDPTNVGPVVFDVHFSEKVTGFTGSDISFAGSTVGGALVANVTDTGNGKDYTVSVTGMTGDGLVVASISAAAAKDLAGNNTLASTSTDNSVHFDNIAPTVTIDQSAGQLDPTSSNPALFDVHFSEPVTGFTGADVSFAGSTVGGTLVANVIDLGNGMDYTVSVSGMFGLGTLVVSIPAGSAIDVAGNANLASTSTDNSVSYDNAGSIKIVSATFHVAEGAGTATITVTRTNGTDGADTISWSTADGTAKAGLDYTASTNALTWLDGEAGDKTFTIPIIDDALNEGRETILLNIAKTSGLAHMGLDTATLTIDPSDPFVLTPTGKLKSVFQDADTDTVTVKLATPKPKVGPMPTVNVYLTDPDGDGKGPIEWIDMANTDPLKSVVSISVAKSKVSADNGHIALAEMTGTGLRSFSGRTVDLDGPGINLNGYLGALTIGDVKNGADITTLAGATTKMKTRISAGQINDGTDIDIGAPISQLSAIRIGDGTITAPSIGTMQVKGQNKPLIAGDLGADITLSGAGLLPGVPALTGLTVAGSILPSVTITAPVVGNISVKKNLSGNFLINGAGVPAGKPAMKNLKVTGAITGGDISVGGNVTLIQAGSIVGSTIFAGYSGPEDGSGIFGPAATVGTVIVTGKTHGFVDSTLIATNFNTVVLTSIDSVNGTDKFGFIADNKIGKLKVVGPLPFAFSGAAPSSKNLDDFEVKIV